MLISAATGAGVTEALRALLAVIDEHRRVENAPTEEAWMGPKI
jgi:Lhr-like helicase